jgi:hypothetical protein
MKKVWRYGILKTIAYITVNGTLNEGIHNPTGVISFATCLPALLAGTNNGEWWAYVMPTAAKQLPVGLVLVCLRQL